MNLSRRLFLTRYFMHRCTFISFLSPVESPNVKDYKRVKEKIPNLILMSLRVMPIVDSPIDGEAPQGLETICHGC